MGGNEQRRQVVPPKCSTGPLTADMSLFRCPLQITARDRSFGPSCHSHILRVLLGGYHDRTGSGVVVAHHGSADLHWV